MHGADELELHGGQNPPFLSHLKAVDFVFQVQTRKKNVHAHSLC